MYVCMYVFMYVCTYVCMYVCMYVFMYVCTYLCMYVCMYVFMYVCTYLCMYVRIYVCMYVFMYVCRYVYAAQQEALEEWPPGEVQFKEGGQRLQAVVGGVLLSACWRGLPAVLSQGKGEEDTHGMLGWLLTQIWCLCQYTVSRMGIGSEWVMAHIRGIQR